MKSFFSFVMVILLVFVVLSFKVNSSDIESIQNNSQKIKFEKITENFCSAKADHFFGGLDNEKTLKYSYFNYIGLKSDERLSKDM